MAFRQNRPDSLVVGRLMLRPHAARPIERETLPGPFGPDDKGGECATRQRPSRESRSPGSTARALAFRRRRTIGRGTCFRRAGGTTTQFQRRPVACPVREAPYTRSLSSRGLPKRMEQAVWLQPGESRLMIQLECIFKPSLQRIDIDQREEGSVGSRNRPLRLRWRAESRVSFFSRDSPSRRGLLKSSLF